MSEDIGQFIPSEDFPPSGGIELVLHLGIGQGVADLKGKTYLPALRQGLPRG